MLIDTIIKLVNFNYTIFPLLYMCFFISKENINAICNICQYIFTVFSYDIQYNNFILVTAITILLFFVHSTSSLHITFSSGNNFTCPTHFHTQKSEMSLYQIYDISIQKKFVIVEISHLIIPIKKMSIVKFAFLEFQIVNHTHFDLEKITYYYLKKQHNIIKPSFKIFKQKGT